MGCYLVFECFKQVRAGHHSCASLEIAGLALTCSGRQLPIVEGRVDFSGEGLVLVAKRQIEANRVISVDQVGSWVMHDREFVVVAEDGGLRKLQIENIAVHVLPCPAMMLGQILIGCFLVPWDASLRVQMGVVEA